MASFGWKRKAGEKVSKATVQLFEAEAEPEAEAEGARHGAGHEEGDHDVDWVHAIKRRRGVLQEDCAAKSKRLKDEGALLAEEGRQWEAVKRWDEAIQLTPEDAALYEMKAQVLTSLQEVFQAVQAAERAVKLRPPWWEAWQTLGRAQLSLGEVDLAVRSFQVAIHLCPAERPLWEEDLSWAQKLQSQSRAAHEKAREEEEVKQQLLHAPELVPDYDFESNEVVAACTAIAERQKHYDSLRKDAVLIDSSGALVPINHQDSEALPQGQFVKARLADISGI
ncbi:tetratricopeptide repeat protein 33 [Conger conger]|uniref:tetratricopeptide repeat protein 33 n=1 Tax=Conger conger TaxID=82655 RepID=UPI002A5ADB5E|nr:tetratricopeptide repeat protein 33 [Conger conger]XP_061118357.1 tetratricopeptide repeat protein 33 [Conger conger]XP_061118358.1 tetratricopeptide repeat protein 33 [Conger conger]XP_061118359.1 tetratricopeptide repeat protein 33 [Conger conger]